MKTGVSVQALAGCAATGLVAVSASGQTVTIDWLPTSTGLWSNPLNWSGGNVPGALGQSARLSPAAESGGDTTPAALVDWNFVVDELTGSGAIVVAVQPGSVLSVGELIAGEGDGILTVQVGDDSASAAQARLIGLGLGGRRGDTTEIALTIIELLGSNAVLESLDRISIEQDSVVTGTGRLTGEIVNDGLIEARDGDVLTLADADVLNLGNIFVDRDSELRFLNTVIEAGAIESNRGMVSFEATTVRNVSLKGVRDEFVVGAGTTFDDVFSDNGVDVIVHEDLPYIASDGIFLNEGNFVIEAGATVDVIGLGDALLVEAGRVTFNRDGFSVGTFRVAEDEELYVLPGATFRGPGVIDGDVFNLGSIAAEGIGGPVGPAQLEIRGDLTMLSVGTLAATVIEWITAPGQPFSRSTLVTGGDVRLAGELVVEYDTFTNGLDAFVGVPFTVLELADASSGHTITGTFDSVRLSLNPVGTSPIPQIDYGPASVEVTIFCLADVNRDGVVAAN
ncbi:MAG: hypothetical protein AAFO89_09440, partial [Planctomycetota bacterium]